MQSNTGVVPGRCNNRLMCGFRKQFSFNLKWEENSSNEDVLDQSYWCIIIQWQWNEKEKWTLRDLCLRLLLKVQRDGAETNTSHMLPIIARSLYVSFLSWYTAMRNAKFDDIVSHFAFKKHTGNNEGWLLHWYVVKTISASKISSLCASAHGRKGA